MSVSPVLRNFLNRAVNLGIYFSKSARNCINNYKFSLSAITAVGLGTLGFAIYHRDPTARTLSSSLADPIERVIGLCFSPECENASNLNIALENNDIKESLCIRWPFRDLFRKEEDKELYYKFNRVVGKAFLNGKVDENVSVFDFIRHRLFSENSLREFSRNPFEELILKEYVRLSEKKGFSKSSFALDISNSLYDVNYNLPAISKENRKNVFEYRGYLNNFNSREYSQDFTLFLKNLQNKVRHENFFKTEMSDTLSLGRPGTRKLCDPTRLGIPYEATVKEARNACRKIFTKIHPDKNKQYDNPKIRQLMKRVREEETMFVQDECNVLGWKNRSKTEPLCEEEKNFYEYSPGRFMYDTSYRRGSKLFN